MLYAKYDSDDSWTVQPQGTPVFTVGIFCEGEDADKLRQDTALQESLDESFFDASEGSGRKAYFDVGRTIWMSAIAATETLDEQHSALERFFEATSRELIALRDGGVAPDRAA